MEVEDSLFMTIWAFVFIPFLAVFAVLGNGVVLGIIARFKKLRTFPNILIANLALADFFNPIINLPMYLLYAVLKVNWFTGKTLAIISLSLLSLFTFVNVVSMLGLLVNMFLAITFDLKYFIASCKGIHDILGFWIPPCGFRILSTGFRIPAQWIPDSKKGWIPNFFCFNAFLRISFLCSNLAILKRRCLECITSLFSFLLPIANHLQTVMKKSLIS